MSPIQLLDSLIKANIPFYWILIVFVSLINTFVDVLIGVVGVFIKRWIKNDNEILRCVDNGYYLACCETTA